MALTERQKVWLEASKEEEQRGNNLTAFLFGLLAQPNENERARTHGEKK